MADTKIDISKKQKPPKLDKTTWEELKYAADVVSNTLMFAPDTVESIYKGNPMPIINRYNKMKKTQKKFFNPEKSKKKKITKPQQKTIDQAAPVINRIVKGDKRKVKLAPKPEELKVNKKMSGGLVGGQAKLDMNKDGMITGQDFKMMPKKYGGKITYRMSGGKVIGAGYDD